MSREIAPVCVCCGQPIRGAFRDDPETFPVTEAHNQCYDSAIAGKIMAGYASDHDFIEFVIFICDDCISDRKENGIYEVRNYD